MWVYDIIVLFEFWFLYIWQINLYTEGLDSPPLIACCRCFVKEILGWARTRMSGLGWRLTWGHYSPCFVWLVFLCFNKSIVLSHRLVSQKKEKKNKISRNTYKLQDYLICIKPHLYFLFFSSPHYLLKCIIPSQVNVPSRSPIISYQQSVSCQS